MPLRLHLILGWLLVIGTLGLIGFWIPPREAKLGESYLIFFFHFPSAINCLNFFLIAGALSCAYLVRRRPTLDLAATTAVEVGVIACTITLATGSIWAKAAWGVWWQPKDPRLMTVAIMWLTYAGYLALRGAIDEPTKRARFCAAFGVVAALNVPLVYFSIKWFGDVSHPMAVDFSELSMVITRWVGAAAFLVLYCALWRLRYRVRLAESEAASLEEAFSRAGI